MLYFLESTTGTGAEPMNMGGSTIIMLVVMVAIFYFMLIRPENKRKKEAENMRSSLKVGYKVTTIGGIMGKVVHVDGDKFVMETGDDQVLIEVDKFDLSTNVNDAERAMEEAKKAEKGR